MGQWYFVERPPDVGRYLAAVLASLERQLGERGRPLYRLLALERAVLVAGERRQEERE